MKMYPDLIFCKKCKIEKTKDNFEFRKNGNITEYKCSECISIRVKNYTNSNKSKKKEYDKIYQIKNKIKRNKQCKDYYVTNTEKIKLYSKKWALENKTRDKINRTKYTEAHKNEKKAYDKEYRQNRSEYDIFYRLKKSISWHISNMLKSCGSSKHGESILKYLPCTIEDLKLHLESQFESWMNWKNRGSYVEKLWDDNDISTWKWQLDHIVPHSDLPYDSMLSDNFKKCWALCNLRPLSAKQNVLDGVKRIRHKKAI